jgi:type II secretory pathway component HofQ
MKRGLALSIVIAVAGPAIAVADDDAVGVDACERGTHWRGARITLDVKDASLPEVFRFLADVGGANIVMGDDIAGRVTMRLTKVPWDQVMCTVAATKQLRVERDGSVYLVRKRPPAAARSTAGATTAWSSTAGR